MGGQEFCLFELDGIPWLKLHWSCVRECGSAAQTFAALRRCSTSETFVAIEKIASYSELSISTTKKHLQKLERLGWVENKGRERTKSTKWLRRTATRRITRDAKKALVSEPSFGMLPGYWTFWKLNWSERVLLAVVISRAVQIFEGLDKNLSKYENGSASGSYVYGEGERFAFSISEIQKMTSLSRQAIYNARNTLMRQQIVVDYEFSDKVCLSPGRWSVVHYETTYSVRHWDEPRCQN